MYVGRVAEWLCRGLQILVRRFDSGLGLHLFSIALDMLFDSFTRRDYDVYSSIVGNISDILDTCNHVNDDSSPYGFGIEEITSFSADSMQKVTDNILTALQKYEGRLKNIFVTHIGTKNGNIIFEIMGDYKDEDNNIKKLHFKKIVDVK